MSAPISAQQTGLDPAVAAVLTHVWQAWRERPQQPESLARISKRTALPMSTLKRTLASLEEAALIQVVQDDKGRLLALLSAEGRGFCAEVLDAPADQAAAEATSRPTSLSADSVRDDQG